MIRVNVVRHHLLRVEKAAKLEKLDGSLFHAYCRAWATNRKNLPLADVAYCGGWTETSTLLRCYIQPTAEALQAVVKRRGFEATSSFQGGKRFQQTIKASSGKQNTLHHNSMQGVH
jgi:hypothetical protein